MVIRALKTTFLKELIIKKAFLYFLIILASLTLQSTFLSLGLVAPDLILILIVAVSINYQSIPGLLFCFFLGLIVDFSSGVYLGPNTAAYVGVFSFIAAVSKRLFADRIFAILALTFMASILKSLIIHSFLFYFAKSEIAASVVETILIEAVLTSVFSSILIFFLNSSKSKTTRKSKGLSFSRASR